MTKFKKLLFGLGTSGFSIATLATVISCGSTSTSLATTDISKTSEVATKRETDVKNALKDESKHKKLNIALLTAGGRINDNSFNQSLWEGISNHAKQVGYNNNIALETNNDAEISPQYDSLLTQDKNVWVLTGFQHGGLFPKWLKTNKDKFIQKKITVIAIDWELDQATLDSIPGQFIALNYKTDEAGWVAGYASASFLAKKYSTDATKRIIAAFGGASGKGVTDFLTGYLSGIKAYNATPGNEIVKFYQDTISLNLGFSVDTNSNTAIGSIINANKKPQIVLSVAGPLTATVVDTIKKSSSNQLIIGVDTDQSNLFGADNVSKFFTSIEKRIGSSLYNALTDLFLKQNANIPGFVPVGQTGAKSVNIWKGWTDQFVGVSNTTLTGDDKTKAEAALTEAKAKFEELITREPELTSIPKMFNGEKGNKNQDKLNELIKEINKQTKIVTPASGSSNPAQA